ncbi:tRNA dimethylallyltransferase [bacterium A37T11]|nr:tRNA dimethylallyltransferase [bacterium A37T11]
MQKALIVILGPTASGKTSLAVALAQQLDGAIISADSRQIYRDMNIGTGKDLAVYGDVPYFLIDILDAGENYSVSHYMHDYVKALASVRALGKQPILCGGTGLYIQAVLQEFNFHIHPGEQTAKAVVKPDELIFGIKLPLHERRARITQRLHKRLREGLLDEVAALLKRGIPAEQLIFYGLEYKYATLYLQGQLDQDTFFARLNSEIHRFAKRQMTYFRKMEKDGIHIHWIDGLMPLEEMVQSILHHPEAIFQN